MIMDKGRDLEINKMCIHMYIMGNILEVNFMYVHNELNFTDLVEAS